MAVFQSVQRSRGSLIVIGVGALLLAALIVQTGIAGVTRYNAPGVTLRVAPGDARALSTQAELTLTADASPAQQAEAAELAKAAIARDPTLGTPYRVLGFIADDKGDRARAKTLITHAEQLSRRDLPTQFWLIDEATGRLDMTAALRHYDIALRTSTLAPVALYPILNKALDEPDVVDALAATLAARPSWGDRYLADAIDKSTALPGLVRLAEQLQARKRPLDGAQTQQLLNRLTESSAFALIAEVRNTLLPAGMRSANLIDPGFDAEGVLYPLNWSYIDKDGVSARQEVENDRNPTALRLGFHADTGRGGEVAHQLLLLKPGIYRLQWTSWHNTSMRLTMPYWSVNCADKGGPSLQTFDLAPAPNTTGAGTFTVPSGNCTGQWLTLALRATNDPSGVSGWVSQVDIVRH